MTMKTRSARSKFMILSSTVTSLLSYTCRFCTNTSPQTSPNKSFFLALKMTKEAPSSINFFPLAIIAVTTSILISRLTRHLRDQWAGRSTRCPALTGHAGGYTGIRKSSNHPLLFPQSIFNSYKPRGMRFYITWNETCAIGQDCLKVQAMVVLYSVIFIHAIRCWYKTLQK